jgi:SOS-response transcriptional repressor LexA
VHKDLTSNIGKHYALEFSTTEENKAGLTTGDLLIVCEQEKSSQQSLVVVQLHQRAQFLKQISVQGKAVELLSLNLTQTSIPMRSEDKIVGCITGLVRKYKH